MQQLHLLCLIAAILSTTVHGAPHYNRAAGRKFIPNPSSGLANLNGFIINTLTSISSAVDCVQKCNIILNCQAAQYQLSTKKCTLFNVTLASIPPAINLTADSDYVSFSITFAQWQGQSSQLSPTTGYYNKILALANSPSCDSSSGYVELGLESDFLEDLAFSSSSTTHATMTFDDPAMFARINNPLQYFCWSPNAGVNAWLRIDLQRFMWVTLIRIRTPNDQYWQQFRIEYSYDDAHNYRTLNSATGLVRYFNGSMSRNGNIVPIGILKPLLSRYWKFIGMVLGTNIPMSMQVSFSGCPAMCKDPLGIENLELDDSSMVASLFDTQYPPEMGRLYHGRGGYKGPNFLMSENTLVIDLKRAVLVSGVQVQGCQVLNYWVITYRVQYKVLWSDPWAEMVDFTLATPFTGNVESKQVSTSFFNTTVAARYVNLIPVTYSGSYPCWKVELLGCKDMPPYMPDLALSKPVTASSADSGVVGNLSLAAATSPEILRQNFVQDAAHVPTNGEDRPLLTVDLGSSQKITSVEIAAPLAPADVSLIPDGLWLFDMLHGSDDISGNENHAIIGNGIGYGAGPDGRPNGALAFTEIGTKRTVLFPMRNLDLNLKSGWTVAMLIYVDSSSAAIDRFALLSFKLNDAGEWGFNLQLRTDSNGMLHTNYFLEYTSNWPLEDTSDVVPFNKWVFVAFSLDCRSGVARHVIGNKVTLKRWIGCPSSAIPINSYGMLGWRNPWVGRLACFQMYQRGLDQSELEQAALCPWLPPAPYSLYPFDCTQNDMLGNGPTFTKSGTFTCDNYNYIPSTAWLFGSGAALTATTATPAFGPVYSFTILFHVYLNNNAGSLFQSQTTGENNNVRFWAYASANSLYYYVLLTCPSGYQISARELVSIRFRNNRWTYLGFTYDHVKKEAGLWFDGELIAKTIYTGSCDGPFLTGTTTTFGTLGGKLACFQLYKTVLKKRQIQSVRRCPWSGIQATFNFPLDNQLGLTNLDDQTYTMTASNAQVTSGFPWVPSTSRSYLFGSGSYLQLTPPSTWFPGNTSFTVGIFTKSTDTSGSNKPILYINGASGNMRMLQQPDTAWSLSTSYNCYESAYTITSTTNVTAGVRPACATNVWIQNVFTLKAATSGHASKLYADGNEIASVSTGACSPKPFGTSIRVARDGGTWAFWGAETCLVGYPEYLEQPLAAEIATCPSPSRIEGHTCDNDLISSTATVTFSSYLVTPQGVALNNTLWGSTWSGDAYTAGSTACCWQPTSTTAASEWVLADFGEEKIVTAIVTSGDPLYSKYITQYKILYSNDSYSYQTYQDRATGSDKVFYGNINKNGRVVNILRPPIRTRYLKLQPVNYERGMALQWAVKGCSDLLCNMELFEPSANVVVSSATDTAQALRCNINSPRDWTAHSTDTNPYFQLKFAEVKLINQIQMQASPSQSSYVRKYHLLYSYDAINWLAYTNKQNGSRIRIFGGLDSGPSSTIISQILKPPVAAMAIRIVVDDYNSQPTARIGIRGCSYADIEPAVPSITVRAGDTAPATATVADSQSNCAATLPASGIPYGSKVTLSCQPAVTGRYLSIVGTSAANDMTIGQVSVYSDSATNFALNKPVTTSSDIGSTAVTTLTDGNVATGSVGSSAYNTWLQVDLGASFPVSKIVLGTATTGWGTSYTPLPWQPHASVCEGTNRTLACPADQLIYIQGTYYANPYGFCGWSNICSGYNNNGIMTIVKSACHLQNNCTLVGSNAIYGDPCGGIGKILGVSYMCIKQLDLQIQMMTVSVSDDPAFATSANCDFVRLDKQASYVPGMSWNMHCTPPLTGRYVRVSKQGVMPIYFSEILVF